MKQIFVSVWHFTVFHGNFKHYFNELNYDTYITHHIRPTFEQPFVFFEGKKFNSQKKNIYIKRINPPRQEEEDL